MATSEVTRFDTADGRRIYRLPLEVFPGFWGNAYLVLGGARPVLVDTGSGQGASNRGLEAGFAAVAERFGEPVTLGDVGTVVLTHGHIDHMGGVRFVARHTDAPVGIHVLDRRVVAGYRERVVMAGRRLDVFFQRAGVEHQRRGRYMALWSRTKALADDAEVGFVFEQGPILGGEMEAIHVPGHCPGQVCLRLGDVLLTADHVLADITPHLSPEEITLHTGMAHYLDSLDAVEGLDGVELALGGHHGEMRDLEGRLAEIRAHHAERLGHVLDLCAEPSSVVDVSRRLFGRVRNYHVLLAVLEAGAHVEHLYQRGELAVTNLDEVEAERDAVVRYRRL